MKSWITIMLLFASIPIKAQAPTDSVAGALLEKEWLYWKAGSDAEKITALLAKAEICTRACLYTRALLELDRAETHLSEHSTEAAGHAYQKMLNYFLSGQYSDASRIVLGEEELGSPERNKTYRLMKLAALNETGQWEACRQLMLELCSGCDSASIEQITGLPVDCPLKSPADCSRFSAFVPGLGQVKAGFLIKGLNSFFIHAGLAVFIAHNFYTGFYIMGIVSGGLPLLKFHAGGKRLSHFLAEEYNSKEIKALKSRYTQVMKQLFVKTH